MELDNLFQAQRQLSEKDLIIYNAELQKKTKGVGLAYCLLIFFGGLGLHKFYLGKVGWGITYLVVATIDFIFFYVIFFSLLSGEHDSWRPPFFIIILFLVSVIFLLYDLFTLAQQVSKYERKLQMDLLSKFGIFLEDDSVNKKDIFEKISGILNSFNTKDFNDYLLKIYVEHKKKSVSIMELDNLFQAQRQLSEKDLIIYNAELQKKTKSVGLAYCLLIFFGGLGLHKFYLGKVGWGITYLVVGTIDFIFFYVIFFSLLSGEHDSWRPPFFIIILFLVSVIFLLYDLFTLAQQVSKCERKLQMDLLSQFGIFLEDDSVNKIDIFEKISGILNSFNTKDFNDYLLKIYVEHKKKSISIFVILFFLLVVIEISSNITEEAKWSELKDEEIVEKAVEDARHASVNTWKERSKTKDIAMEKNKDNFIDNKNGTVTFKSNSLMWQKCSIGLTWNGKSCAGDIRELTWNDTKSLSSDFAGYKDWRLPTKEELMTLIYCHDNNSNGMCESDNNDDDDFIAINYLIFSDVRELLYKFPSPYPYWTSTPYDVSESYSVDVLSCIDFNFLGHISMCSKNNEDRGFVRLVRESDKI